MILGKNPSWYYSIREKMQKRPAKLGIGGVLTVFIVALIAVVLAGPFQTQVTNNLVNYTGGASAIGDQLPLFYVLLIVAIVIAPVAKEFSALD